MSSPPLCVAAFAPELSAITTPKRVVGIGLIAASAGAALAIAELRPRAVVLLGTCGAYPKSSLSVGDVIVATGLRLASAAEARGHGALLHAMTAEVELDVSISSALEAVGARRATVATTLAITTDDDLAAALQARYSCDAEHLEAYAVACACVNAKVPFACVLGVTNVVGSNGRAQWRENRVMVEAATGALVERWLRNPS